MDPEHHHNGQSLYRYGYYGLLLGTPLTWTWMVLETICERVNMGIFRIKLIGQGMYMMYAFTASYKRDIYNYIYKPVSPHNNI